MFRCHRMWLLLETTKLFLHAFRCSDATECGSYLSALRCECSGIILPIHPLDYNSPWRYIHLSVYTVKKVSGFSVPSQDVTDQTLPGRELLNYSRPVWYSVVSDIPAWDGKTANLFLQCSCLSICSRKNHHVRKEIMAYSSRNISFILSPC
jgi:hypothetical protein